MEMHQVRYFLALSEELNFTRAAERCHVAQPSLTRAIKQLEDELGGALFRRERANTHLTELGRTLKPYLEQVFTRAEEAKREAQEFIRLQKTPLRLGLMCTIAPAYLLDLVTQVRVRHPGIELQIIDAAARQLQERLVAGALDIAVYALPSLPTDERLHHLALYREQFQIVLAPRHPLAARSAIRVKDLDGEHYLCRINCEMGEAADAVFDAQGVAGPTVYQSERDDWILAMAAAGLGYAFMPALCVDHPGVIGRPLIEPEIWREVALVTVRGRPHSPGVGALVQEAMRLPWAGRPALAVQQVRSQIPS
jgi:LysR family hydrogen peroxide-inducible transcriptional activator